MWHDHNKYSTSRTLVGHVGGSTAAGIFLVLRDQFQRPVALTASSSEAAAEAAPTRNPMQMIRNSVASFKRQYPRPLIVFWITNYFASAVIAGVAGSCTLKMLGTGEVKKATFDDNDDE